jgi:hypothetical protein
VLFFYFLGSFLPSSIRIRIRKLYADPDPEAQINAAQCGSGSETLFSKTTAGYGLQHNIPPQWHTFSVHTAQYIEFRKGGRRGHWEGRGATQVKHNDAKSVNRSILKKNRHRVWCLYSSFAQDSEVRMMLWIRLRILPLCHKCVERT